MRKKTCYLQYARLKHCFKYLWDMKKDTFGYVITSSPIFPSIEIIKKVRDRVRR